MKPKNNTYSGISNFSKWQFILLFLVIASLFSAGGYWSFRHEMDTIKREKYNELRAIADLKTNQVLAWRQERMVDARLNSASRLLREAVEQLKSSPDDPALIEDILSNLNLLRNLQEYENVVLAAPDGRVLVTLDSRLTVLETETRELVALAVSAYEPVFGDFFRCPMCGEIHLDVAAPLVNDENQTLAVLILRINPETFLYPLIQSWPLPGNSAETLLVRREGKDVLFLNMLRFRPDQPLSVRIPVTETFLPAVRAVMGETGQFEGTDYQGIKVLSDIRHVPDSPWFLVTKINADEIFADLYHREGLIFLLTLLMVLLSGAGVGLIYKHKGKRAFESLYLFEREKNEAQEKIRIINQVQSKLLETEDIVEIYRLVAEQIHELLGKGIAITSILDEATQTVRMVAYYGLNLPISRIIKMLGMDPTKTAYSLKDMTEDELQLFRSGGLEQLPDGIYALATRKIPKTLCDMVEKLLGVDGVYTMGFVWEGKHLGGLTILASSDISSKKDAVELIMNNASITINRIRGQERLIASETRYRRLFESAKDGILILDALSGQVIDVNPFLFDLLGYSKEEFLGKELWEISLFKDISESKESFLELQNKGYIRYEDLLLETRDGRSIDVEFVSNVYLVNDKKVIQCNIRDITERKQAEEQLRTSENRFRDVAQSMADWIWEVDRNGKYTYVSDTVMNVLGYSAEELIGKTPFELMPVEEADKIYEVFREIVSKSGPIVDLENWNLAKDGTEVCLLTNGVPIISADGELKGYRGVDKDISTQKRLETERISIENQLRQAQKMESVGRLAGGVAHDYNNALSAIIGFTEMAMDEVDPAGRVRADLDEVLKAAKHAADITRQLLAFARKQIIAPTVLDLNENVEGMLKMLRRLIGENINLSWLPGAGLWPVKMDPSQIDQILANLCVNARDAIKDVGKVTIETDTVTFDAAYCSDHTGFVPGEFVLLAVSDDGCGMDKELLDKIFEPFFTTKAVDKGTGLGLATVYGIVKQNNGFVNVYSEPGKGTTIKIYLPRHEGEAVEIQDESTAEIPQGQGETVLVVEDDLSILKLAKKILDGLGYTVLTAGTPGEAMGLAEEHVGEIHLLLTDVIMPEMNGRELAQQLQSLYPDIKLMFMSGYTANAIAHHGVLDEGVQFIQKPFSKKDLATIVRKALDEQ